MNTIRAFLVLLLALLPCSLLAQQGGETADRTMTGGAQTLDDILARQRGEQVPDAFRRNATGDPDRAAGIEAPLGTLGGISDAEVLRALRYGSANVRTGAGGGDDLLIQDRGMWWLSFREGPLRDYGGGLLALTVVLLALFFLVRGRIRIEGARTGETILRFGAIERFGHWLLAGSFVLLALSGLITLFGRVALIPILGKDGFATLAIISKWIHNNVAWAFMLGLAWVFVTWVIENIPNRTDLAWLARGGGLFSRHSHPPARKFNAGQKIVFWAVIILGISVSASGISLLLPFELPMFAKTFATLNALGLPQALGLGELREVLTPHDEMHYAQIWHAIIAFFMMAIVIAHIYIGSLGMEGAFDAMESGKVEKQWAKEHHSLWYEQTTGDTPTTADKAPGAST